LSPPAPHLPQITPMTNRSFSECPHLFLFLYSESSCRSLHFSTPHSIYQLCKLRLELLPAQKVAVSWHVMPCGLVNNYPGVPLPNYTTSQPRRR